MIGMTKSTTARIEAAAAELARLRRSIPSLEQEWETALRAGDDDKAVALGRQSREAQAMTDEVERRLVVLRDLRRDEIAQTERQRGAAKAAEAAKAAGAITARLRDAVAALENAEVAISRACDSELLGDWSRPATEAVRLAGDYRTPELPPVHEVQKRIERALESLSAFTGNVTQRARLMGGAGADDWLPKNVERIESAEWQAAADKAGLTG